MKEICFFILILLVLWLGSENLKLRQNINSKDTLTQSDSIYHLKYELYVKDSLIMNIQDCFKDEKEAIRFKKLYFNN